MREDLIHHIVKCLPRVASLHLAINRLLLTRPNVFRVVVFQLLLSNGCHKLVELPDLLICSPTSVPWSNHVSQTHTYRSSCQTWSCPFAHHANHLLQASARKAAIQSRSRPTYFQVRFDPQLSGPFHVSTYNMDRIINVSMCSKLAFYIFVSQKSHFLGQVFPVCT